MLKGPKDLQKKYSSLLINSEIFPAQYGNCRKWLRYYLNFCKNTVMHMQRLKALSFCPFFLLL